MQNVWDCEFPRPQVRVLAFLCADNRCNLPSTFFDVKMIRRYLERDWRVPSDQIHTFTNQCLDKSVPHLVSDLHQATVSQIQGILQPLVQSNSEPLDIIWTMSLDSAVVANASLLIRNCLNHWLRPVDRVMVLVDMCESGAFLQLPYYTDDAQTWHQRKVVAQDSKPQIACISAVGPHEYDQDSICVDGYGGGLTCDFMDFVRQHPGPAVNWWKFYQYRVKQCRVLGVHSFFSCNQNLSE